MKFALLHERKATGDKRVLFSPLQLAKLKKNYPKHQFIVESSPTRCFTNQEYRNQGITVRKNITDCDIFLGIKEIPSAFLIAGKTYFFFSHTTKMQSHNKGYLKKLKETRINFFDYENFTDPSGNRLIAFGKSAGQIGAYHAIRTYGLKQQLFNLPNPHHCNTVNELHFFATNSNLPPVKIVVTGTGNVGTGIADFFNTVGIRKISPADFLNKTYTTPTFTQLSKKEYLAHKKNNSFNNQDFKKNPDFYKSDFLKYAQQADILVAGHYYHKGMPLFFTAKEIQSLGFKINTIADISCDILAPLPTCLRVSTPKNPIYGYHKHTGLETDFLTPESIAVMAVDNLPCELPITSSINFGKQFIDNILPFINKDLNHPILQKAWVLKNGTFTQKFSYLEAFIATETYQFSQ